MFVAWTATMLGKDKRFLSKDITNIFNRSNNVIFEKRTRKMLFLKIYLFPVVKEIFYTCDMIKKLKVEIEV